MEAITNHRERPQLLIILEVIYHIKPEFVVTLLDCFSEQVKRDLVVLCAKGRTKIDTLEVPTAQQTTWYNFLTLIGDNICVMD